MLCRDQCEWTDAPVESGHADAPSLSCVKRACRLGAHSYMHVRVHHEEVSLGWVRAIAFRPRQKILHLAEGHIKLIAIIAS